MQDILGNLDIAEILQTVLDIFVGLVIYFIGLLPGLSSHSLGILEWFVIALLSGVAIFIKFYDNGIILETVSYTLSQSKPYVRQFNSDVSRFARRTTGRKSKSKKVKRRR